MVVRPPTMAMTTTTDAGNIIVGPALVRAHLAGGIVSGRGLRTEGTDPQTGEGREGTLGIVQDLRPFGGGWTWTGTMKSLGTGSARWTVGGGTTALAGTSLARGGGEIEWISVYLCYTYLRVCAACCPYAS